MVAGVSGAGGGAPQLQSPLAKQTAGDAEARSGKGGNSVINAGGSKAIGSSNVPDPLSVKPPSIVVKGPGAGSGQRGSLVDTAA